MRRIKLNKSPKGLNVYELETGVISGILYDTEIFRYDRSTKRVTIKNGGWVTAHTRNCINRITAEMLPELYVFIKRGRMIFKHITQGVELPFSSSGEIEVQL